MPAAPATLDGRRLAAVAVLASITLVAGCSGGTSRSSASTPVPTVTVTVTVPAPEQPQPTAAVPAARTVPDVNADLKVKDQFGTGHSVLVDEVQISNGTGYVAVFSAGGILLGSVRVTPTVRQVTVPLARPVPATSVLLAQLYADNGDGRFAPATDPRVVDDEGKFVDDTFDYTLQ